MWTRDAISLRDTSHLSDCSNLDLRTFPPCNFEEILITYRTYEV